MCGHYNNLLSYPNIEILSFKEGLALKRLNENNPLPLYHQLKKILSEKILNHEWEPETQIPTEEQLVEEYGVSRSTVRTAVLDLMRSGTVYRKRGKGTFVSPSKATSDFIHQIFFSKEYERDDVHVNFRILMLAAEVWISEILGLETGEQIFEFIRIRYFRNEKSGIEKIYIPVKKCPGLIENPPEGKFSEWLQRTYGFQLSVKEKIIEATVFDKEESLILEVEKGAPALLYSRLRSDQNGNLVYYTKTLLRGDRFRINIPTSCMGNLIDGKI